MRAPMMSVSTSALEMQMTELPQEIKRWTAKRRTALVLQLLRGETTVAEAARQHDLKPSEIEHWKETFLAAGENGLKSRPREELERKDVEIQKLKQKVGELVMDIDILKDVHKRAQLDPFTSGWSSDD
jgi:transposase-like protein